MHNIVNYTYLLKMVNIFTGMKKESN